MNTQTPLKFYTEADKPFSLIKKLAGWHLSIRMIILLFTLTIVFISIAGEFFAWPGSDEAIITLKGKLIADGFTPYRDFNEFITPFSEILTAVIIKLFGYHYVIIRGVILLGWIGSLYLIWQLAKPFLPASWRILLIIFLFQTDTRYLINQHHFWSGLLSLAAVYTCYQWQKAQFTLSKNKSQSFWIILSGLFCGLTCWTTQTAGLAISIALFAFLSIQALKIRSKETISAILYFPITILLTGLIGVVWLMQVNAWDKFIEDSFIWLSDGHYSDTTVGGYFVTGLKELADTIKPLMAPLPFSIKLLFAPRIFIYLHLWMIAILPVFGLIITITRLFQSTSTEEKTLMQLYGLGGVALLLSTFSYSTSMHIVSNCNLLYLLAFIGIYKLVSIKEPLKQSALKGGIVFCGLLLFATLVASSSKLILGSWVPPANSTSIQGTYLHTGQGASTETWTTLFESLKKTLTTDEKVFVLGQLPEIYMLSGYQNATRFPMVIPVYTSERQEKEIVTQLNSNPPKIIIQDNSYLSLRQDHRFKHYPTSELRLRIIESWLACHYQPFQQIGGFYIFKLNSENQNSCLPSANF